MFLTLLSHIHLLGLCRGALKLLVRVPLGAEEESVCSCRVQFASLVLLSLHSNLDTVPTLLCSVQFPCVSVDVPTDRVMAQAFVFVP